jgi:hypothetical protein
MPNLNRMLVAASLLALTQSSFANDMYVGLAGGLGKTQDTCGAGQTCDTSNYGGKFHLGYFLSRNIALEGGLRSFGKAELKSDTDGSRITLRRSSIGAGAAGWLQFTDDLNGVLRAGLASNKTTVQTQPLKGSRTETSDRGTSPYVGAGLLYSMGPVLHLTTDLDLGQYKQDGGKVNVKALSMGLVLKF